MGIWDAPPGSPVDPGYPPGYDPSLADPLTAALLAKQQQQAAASNWNAPGAEIPMSGMGTTPDQQAAMASIFHRMVDPFVQAENLPQRVLEGQPVDPVSEGLNFAGAVTMPGLGRAALGGAAERDLMGMSGAADRAATGMAMDDPSRLARANAMGFRSNMPLEAAIAPSDEKIAAPAIDVNGRMYTAPTHLEAYEQAERDLGSLHNKDISDGYLTNSGRYVGRWEASDIASRQSQGAMNSPFEAERGIASENINPAEGPATSPVRIGATAPGLPGGQGVWTRWEPGASAANQGAPPIQDASAATAQLWHRTERPAQLDARGLAHSEIQASLQNAWDSGHDAVMLKNYSTPSGEIEKNIVVVKDPSQLRSPQAAFDPTQRYNPNIFSSGGADERGGPRVPLAGMLGNHPSDPGMPPGYAPPVDPLTSALMAQKASEPPSFTAYHGSPHSFDQFDISKIGTGEGAQSYGHGLYFAGNEGVAKSYKSNLSGSTLTLGDKQYMPAELSEKLWKDSAGEIDDPVRATPSFLQGVMDAVHETATTGKPPVAPEDLSSWMGYGTMAQKQGYAFAAGKLQEAKPGVGSMYQVQIHADPEHFLNWDAPYADQHPKVQQAINDLWTQKGGTLEGREYPPFVASSNNTGEDMHAAIATTYGGAASNNTQAQAAAAQALRDAGIPGIKYLDAGSRNVSGTSRAEDFAIKILDEVGGNRQKAIERAKSLIDQTDPKYRDSTFLHDTRGLLESDWKDPRTHNYVTFSDDIIKILKKYGLGGLGIGTGAGLANWQPQQQSSAQ